MTRITGRRYRQALASALLGASLLAWPIVGGQPAALAADRTDVEDAAEKAADLRQALANRGTSPTRLVVLYESDASPDDAVRAEVRQRVGGRLLRADRALSREVLRVSGATAETLARRIRGLPGVRDAYPDQVASIRLAVNDPLAPQEWGLAKIQAQTAWDTSQGQGVTVAV
ncbi:MAG: hypothetical protein ACRDJN_00035, partial [Chloroflexota bacterium]